MASYLHPVSAFLYAGLAPEGSSFDTKRAAKAAAMQQIGEYAVKQMQAQGAPGMDGSAAGTGGPAAPLGEFDYSYDGTNVMAGDAIPTDIPTEVYPVDMASRSVTETILPPGAAAPPPPPPPPPPCTSSIASGIDVWKCSSPAFRVIFGTNMFREHLGAPAEM
jgi:hypothetical protein